MDINVTNFCIEACIEDQEFKCQWWLIRIYASTEDQTRREQWKYIEQRKRIWGDRWIVTRDFNDIRSNEEK